MKRKKILILAIAGLCLLFTALAALCYGQVHRIIQRYPDQYMAERWQGEGEISFCQYSCFFPTSEGFDRNGVGKTRNSLAQYLLENSYPREQLEGLFVDAWSGSIDLSISNERASNVKVNATAVGGSFFQFHPIRLLSGSTLSDEDFSNNRILVDTELAWKLFGSTDIEGQLVFVGDKPFSIAGVFEPADDPASKKAQPEGRQAYVLYSAFTDSAKAENDPPITCYELVMPEPVKGFTRIFVEKNVTGSGVELLQNTGRFSDVSLLRTAHNRLDASIRTGTALLPPWENVARYTAAKCASLLLAAIWLLVFPALCLAAGAVFGAIKGISAVREDLIPAAGEKLEHSAEAYRAWRREKRNKQ